MENKLDNITKENIRDYISKHGRKGAMTVDGLSKLLPSLQMTFETELGREILNDDIERHEFLLIKIVEMNATDEDKIEFRYLRDRIISLGKKLELFFNYLKNIKE